MSFTKYVRAGCGCFIDFPNCSVCKGEINSYKMQEEWARMSPARRRAENEELERRCAEKWQAKYKSPPKIEEAFPVKHKEST